MAVIPDFEGLYSRFCSRCELRYRKEEKACPHCYELSDDEVSDLKARSKREADGIKRIRFIILFIAIVSIFVLFMFTL